MIEPDQLEAVELQAIPDVLNNALKEYRHLTTVLARRKYRLHPIYFLCSSDLRIVYLFENLSK
ncbi:MAG: hypothetical protein HWN68_15885 [Desulfobacterales bacterium]|nr:hypothetical protein [Desulfobacterales bacterium]